MAEDADQAIWITVEGPATEDVHESIVEELEDTALADRYQIIVTDEEIDTINMDELRDLPNPTVEIEGAKLAEENDRYSNTGRE